MKFFIIFSIIAFVLPLIAIQSLNITTIDDLALDKDSAIYGGEGDVCITPYTETKCQEGLVCILISTTPHVNGVCRYPGDGFEEDYVNRKENFERNEILTSDLVLKNLTSNEKSIKEQEKRFE